MNNQPDQLHIHQPRQHHDGRVTHRHTDVPGNVPHTHEDGRQVLMIGGKVFEPAEGSLAASYEVRSA